MEAWHSYQSQRPYKTVVPPPPHTVLQHIRAVVLTILSGLLRTVALLGTPIFFILHLLLLYIERRERKSWLAFHEAWSHRSMPHERPLKYEENHDFPLSEWHLRCEDGRQRWYYGEPLADAEEGNLLSRAHLSGFDTVEEWEEAARPEPTSEDQQALGDAKWAHRRTLERYQMCLDTHPDPAPRDGSEDAMEDGVSFLLKLQDPFSGHWPNDYSGCMFLTPGLIISQYIMAKGDLTAMFSGPVKGHRHVDASGKEVECQCAAAARSELIRYLRNYQNADGGFGQHTEGHSCMIGSVLSYVMLRLLGVPAHDDAMVACKQWIHAAGGAGLTPAWGKVWLAILGVYSWDGVDPILPELILLPNWVPFSLRRTWCHSRVIAIPFSYFYGRRWSAPAYAITQRLREELYIEPYDRVKWSKYRGACCSEDLYTPPTAAYKLAVSVMGVYEKIHFRWLRRLALEENWRHMAYDDENTSFICLGPVNKSLNMLATWEREGDDSTRVALHKERVWDYLYMNRAGMKMSGYNGSQLWDTSFAVQAIHACQLTSTCPNAMQLAHHYVNIAQVQEDPMNADQFHRHRTKGAWNFSTSNQGWQVSDCTAEGLRVILLLPHLPFPKARIFDAVDELLSLRNSDGDGGWASYEPTRGPTYLELFNCAELFKDVMLEYSYAECSSSCIHTLSLFRQAFPEYRTKEVNRAIREGIACVLGKQRPDGSFYGSWAVCFTYGAWIVSSALECSGELPEMEEHPNCQQLVNFLLGHQNHDGGWGEDINSCVREEWTDNPDGSQVINTAWAVMAIMKACGRIEPTPLARRNIIREAVTRGIHFIMSRQLSNGDWRQERISGVFNGNNPIHYPGYKNAMTVWALGTFNQWKHRYTSHCPSRGRSPVIRRPREMPTGNTKPQVI